MATDFFFDKLDKFPFSNPEKFKNTILFYPLFDSFLDKQTRTRFRRNTKKRIGFGKTKKCLAGHFSALQSKIYSWHFLELPFKF